MSTLTAAEIADAGLSDWAHVRDGLQTRLLTGDFATGLRLVAAIGAIAESTDHHPDLDLHYDYLDIRLTSHDVKGVSRRDLRLAHSINEIATADGVGMRAKP